jgi:hypothetical protein
MPTYAFHLTVGDSDLTTSQYETAVAKLEDFFGTDATVEHWVQGGFAFSRVVTRTSASNIVSAMEDWVERLRYARDALQLPEHATVGISVGLRDVSYPSEVMAPSDRSVR